MQVSVLMSAQAAIWGYIGVYMTWVTTNTCTFYLHDDESLLNGLIRTGHNVDYQCREGYCGSCRVSIISHSQEVAYKDPPLATINKDELLACCCRLAGVVKLKI